jgi:hypothetical protein
MGKYFGFIPLIATAYVKIEAENENEAFEKLRNMYEKGAIDLMGFDNECESEWWVEEE